MLALLLALTLASDPTADLEKARSLAAAGDLAQAGAVLKNVTATFPTWGLAQIELSKVLLEYPGEEAALSRSLAAARALEPLNPRAWLLSGRHFQRLGEPDKALEAYRRAVALRPDLADARAGLGAALFEAGRFAEAVPELKLGVQGRPDDRALAASLAEACEKTGDLAGAEAALRALVASAPQNAIFRRRLVDFLDRTGKAEEAAAEVKKLDSLGGRPARKLRPLKASKR